MDDSDDAAATSARRRFRLLQVVSELIATEKTYVRNLDLLVDLYVTPLSTHPKLSSKTAPLFRHVSTIAQLQHNLLLALEQTSPAEAFSTYAPYLRAYSQFITSGAQHQCARLRQSSRRFVEFCAQAQADPRCGGNSLESLLVLPVQRVPRYKLLLEQVLKYTPPEGAAAVLDALNSVRAVADEINEAVRAQENRDSVLEVQQQFEGEVFVAPHRRLVRSGGGLFLFNDLLVVSSGGSPPLRVERRLPVNGQTLADAVAAAPPEWADELRRLTEREAAAAMLKAARTGDGPALDALLVDGAANLAACDANGWSAAALAADGGHAGVLVALLRHGADPDAANAQGQTPLHAAAASSQWECVTALLDSGAQATAEDSAGRMPADLIKPGGGGGGGGGGGAERLLQATLAEVVAEGGDMAALRRLLAAGADPDLPMVAPGVPRGTTPVMHCVSVGNFKFVDVLLRAGVRLLAENADGQMAASMLLDAPGELIAATGRGGAGGMGKTIRERRVIVEGTLLLRTVEQACEALRGGDGGDGGAGERALVRIAGQRGDVRALGALLASRGGRNALHEAAAGGAAAAVRALLGGECDDEAGPLLDECDAADAGGMTPLQLACAGGHARAAAELLDVSTVDANARGPGGRTALLLAAAGGHRACVQALAGAPASAQRPMHQRLSSAFSVSSFGGGQQQQQQQQQQRRCDLAAADDRGANAVAVALEAGHDGAAALLAKLGVPVTAAQLAYARDDEARARLLLVALCRAAAVGDASAIEALPADSARHLDARDRRGRSAAMYAARAGHEAALRALLARGASAGLAADAEAGAATALHLAAARGHAGCVEALLAAGCAVDARDAQGRSAAALAARAGHAEVARVLVAAGATAEEEEAEEGKGGEEDEPPRRGGCALS